MLVPIGGLSPHTKFGLGGMLQTEVIAVCFFAVLISPGVSGRNRALYDTSMKFGTQLEHAIRNIFGYRAIADLSCGNHGSHFPKWPPSAVILPITPVLDHLGS